MRTMHGNVKIFSLIFLGILIISCASCGIGTTKIGDIAGHPRDYAGKEVSVSGEVTETFSLFVVKYFVLRDSSGEITVVTDRPLPAKGEKIKVKGVVKEAFSIGDKTSLVLVEGTEKASR
jgi:aspartyl/asparaginyl-tRNA synthetase